MVDIGLRAAVAVLIPQDVAPALLDARRLKYTDGARPHPGTCLGRFPFLDQPLPGSRNKAAALAGM